jgi:hypothetical protein
MEVRGSRLDARSSRLEVGSWRRVCCYSGVAEDTVF